MDEGLDHIVYSKNVLEFVTVGNEYCNQLENAEGATPTELVSIMVKILPLLYIKAVVLPKTEYELEEQIEKYVSEEEYVRMQHALMSVLGANDDFLEVFVSENEFDEQNVASSISEHLTDIYQDIKDFLFAYRIGQTEIMNDALLELITNFELHWGQRLVNVLRACHNLVFGEKNLEDDIRDEEPGMTQKSNDWFNNFQDQWADN